MRAIASVNPEHSSISAMSGVAGPAQLAITAARIYLTNNTTTDECTFGAVFHHADEFVTDRSIEPCIPACDLEVGVADARQEHTHQRLMNTIRFLNVFDCESFFIDAEGKHLVFILAADEPRLTLICVYPRSSAAQKVLLLVYAFCGVSSMTCFVPVTVTGRRHSSCSSPESVACNHQLPGASSTDPDPCLSRRAFTGDRPFIRSLRKSS